MKILFLPCRSTPFNVNRISGGLESVQYKFVKNMSKVHEIHYISFGDEFFGDLDIVEHCCDAPIGNKKITTKHIWAIRTTLRKLDLNQYDAIVSIEINTSSIKELVSANVSHKLINILATPFDPHMRAIIGTWISAINVHQNKGINVVPTKAFKQLSLEYPNHTHKILTDQAMSPDMLEYWKTTDIISDMFYPPILIDSQPVVKPSKDYAVSLQRWDPKFRKTNVAFETLRNTNGYAFTPKKWICPKKWQKYPWVYIDSPRDKIKPILSEAKVLLNTCNDTGTVENCSLEAISMGVPVLQLLNKNTPHATLEYDPTTVVVEITKDMTTSEITEKYTNALLNFDDTLESRINRANSLYATYNKSSYYDKWNTILETRNK